MHVSAREIPLIRKVVASDSCISSLSVVLEENAVVHVAVFFVQRRNQKVKLLACYDVIQECGGHAEDAHQQVADRQVEDEEVGDGAHVLAPQHDEAHHAVAHHAHQEDEQVGHDEDGSRGRLVKVESHVGDVVPGQGQPLPLHLPQAGGGVVKRPVVAWWSEVALECFIHFEPEEEEKRRCKYSKLCGFKKLKDCRGL